MHAELLRQQFREGVEKVSSAHGRSLVLCFVTASNYFGDFCIWWAFYLFAVAAGGWWSIAAPLLMSFLLLRVSGVAMLEKTITNRRPEYADYIQNTNAFFPGPARKV